MPAGTGMTTIIDNARIMKLNIKTIIILAALFIVAACTKDLSADRQPAGNSRQDAYRELSVTLGPNGTNTDATNPSTTTPNTTDPDNSGTKMTFGEDQSSLIATWSAGDAISLTPSITTSSDSRVYTLVSGEGESTAKFICEDPVDVKSTSWTAYFPSSVKCESDYNNFSFAGQVQNGDNSSAHLSAYNLMKKTVTFSEASPAPKEISFSGDNFSQTSCMKIVISNLPEAIIADSLIFESYRYSTKYYGGINTKVVTTPLLSMKMSFTSMTVSTSLTAYMMLPAKNTIFSNGEFFKITVKAADGTTYTTERKFTSTTKLEAGKYHTLKISKLWIKDEGIDGTWGTFQNPTATDIKYPYCSFIIMGDGYTNEDYKGGDNSTFMIHARRAYDALFLLEPFKSLKGYFGVYYVNAVSAQKINTVGFYYNGAKNIDTHTTFELEFTPNSTSITGNTTRVLYYCGKVSHLSPAQVSRTVAIVIGNKECRAGMTYIYYAPTSSLEFCEYYSIAFCALGLPEAYRANEFEELIVHEAGGHGFGKLSDEYTTSSYYPDLEAAWKEVASAQSVGLYKNIDKYTTDTEVANTLWHDLADITEYSPEIIDVYPGAFAVKDGFCRSTSNSMMRDNTIAEGYFNAVSRRAIYHRAMRLVGKTKIESENGFLPWDTSHLPVEGPYAKTKAPLTPQDPNRLPLAQPKLVEVR